jgi:hypothetical protein
MRRQIALAVFVLAVGAAGTPTALAGPKLTADYGFENNFKSSKGNAKDLKPEGPIRTCPCAKFAKETIDGKKQGVWKWPEGDGLRLDKAKSVLGGHGKTYTFAMLVNLDHVSGYRKLIDFNDLTEDFGWYAYDRSLYPYSVSNFDYDKTPIQADNWRQIVLTRNSADIIGGYVDGQTIDKVKDRDKDVTLVSDVLHFLLDDHLQDGEHTGGEIARLRIWDDALGPKQVKNLGS